MSSELSALIIDPEGDSKVRVKHALQESLRFKTVDSTGNLEENLRKIAFGTVYDVIFISQRLNAEDISSFIKRAKSTQAGSDSTFIMISHSNEVTTAALGVRYASGVDGFLLHPYSSDRLDEIVALSFQVKKERAEIRNRVGLTLLVADLVDQINLIAFLKGSGFDVGLSMRKLYELCKPLQGMGDDALAIYFEIVLNLFPEAPFPGHFHGSEEYKGLSDRVKKRMERKLVAELDSIRDEIRKSREETLRGGGHLPKVRKEEG